MADSKNPVLHAFGEEVQVELRGEQTAGTICIVLAVTPPGGGPPPHRHRNEDETFLILEGQFRFLQKGEWTEHCAGSTVYLPRGEVHTFQNVGDAPGRTWVISTPSGFEKFFEECAAVFTASQGGPPNMAQILAIANEHCIEFVPPLGSPKSGDPARH